MKKGILTQRQTGLFLFSLIALFWQFTAYGQESKGVHFRAFPAFSLALKEAQRTNRPVFLDFYTTWCQPCRTMDQKIYPVARVGAYVNARFIALKFDAERGEGARLAKKYAVQGFPTLLILTPKGDILQREEGASSAGNFLEFAAEGYAQFLDQAEEALETSPSTH